MNGFLATPRGVNVPFQSGATEARETSAHTQRRFAGEGRARLSPLQDSPLACWLQLAHRTTAPSWGLNSGPKEDAAVGGSCVSRGPRLSCRK